MNTALIVLKQIVMMFLLLMIGFVMYRKKKISDSGAKSLANILIYLSLPCVIIKGFLIERTPEHTTGLLMSAAVSLAVLLICVIVARIFMKKDGIGNFAAAFSNPGFFGVPLITACLGDGAVFYIAAFIAFLNVMQWSYGISVMTGNKGQLTVKKIVTAPFMIAIFIGFFFYFTAIPMPGILEASISHLAGMNTPAAMFTIGIYLAQTDLVEMVKKRSLYLISLVRLVVIPVIVLLLLKLLPGSMADLKLAILIAAACPVGANVATYAQLHDCDYTYAVETVVVSTALSLATMPILIRLSEWIW